MKKSLGPEFIHWKEFCAFFSGAHSRGVSECVGKGFWHYSIPREILQPKHATTLWAKYCLNTAAAELAVTHREDRHTNACNIYFVFILFTRRNQAQWSQKKMETTSSYAQHLMNKSIVSANPIVSEVREIKLPRASLTSELWEVPDYITGYLSK